MLNLLNELLLCAFLRDDELAVLALSLEALCGKGAAVNDLLGVLGDVDEAACTSQTGAELGNVQVAVRSGLSQAEECNVKAAALIEVELYVVRDDALCVSSSAELGAAVGNTCDGACLNGQGHLVGDALFSSYVCDLLRCAGAEVYDSILRQLHSSTAGDDLLGIHRDRRDCVNRDAELAGQCAVIRHTEALHILLVGADYNGVNIDARDSDQLRVQRTALNDLLDLNDYLAAGVLAGLRHSGNVQRTDLAMYGAVAVLIAVRSTQEYNVDREALVQQALLTLDVNNLYQIFLGNVVQLAAAVARVSKGLQTNVGDGADVVGSDVAVHMGDNALRQVVSLDLVVQSELTELRSAVPVAADNALYHALVAVMVAAGAVAVALTGCEEQGQVLRMAGFQKTLLKSLGKGFRAGTGYETAGSNGIAVLNLQGSLLRGDDAYFLHVYQSS